MRAQHELERRRRRRIIADRLTASRAQVLAELAGFTSLAIAGFLTAAPLGFLVVGVALLAVGNVNLARSKK